MSSWDTLRQQDPNEFAATWAQFSQPRGLVYRTFILNHLVHHRAQLGVFLRMLGVAVPAVYNDSADEKGGMFMEG